MIGIIMANRFMVQEGFHTVLDSEVVDWLTEHVGLGCKGGGWKQDCSWLWCWHSPNHQEAVVVIPDPEKAMMFKLTWGGR